jgi:hypothetical protein
MLKAFFISAALFIASQVSAQTNQFVEVVVEDTMQIEAEEIIYVVGFVDWTTTTDAVAADTMPTALIPPKPKIDHLQKVRQILQALQLDTLKENEYSVSPYESYHHSTISVRFRSVDKLKEFTNRIRKLENIRGSITTTSSSRETAAEKILFQRLFNQAKAKAETLAQIAGKKLGTAVSVKEKDAQGGWTMYPPISALGDRHTETAVDQNGKIRLYRCLIVQFSWQ